MYKETSHFSSRNMVETSGGGGRGGYGYHTRHSSSHNPGDHGILLHMPGPSCHVDDSIHEN